MDKSIGVTRTQLGIRGVGVVLAIPWMALHIDCYQQRRRCSPPT